MLQETSGPATDAVPTRHGQQSAPAWRFGTVPAQERVAAERFIAVQFHKAYGARISRFMPELVALHFGGEILGACGLREAAAERLFLETYLDVPAEQALSRTARASVSRDGIVEVGNLSVARAGAARRFILRLTLHLHNAGAEWVLFSAVPALRNNFLRLGIPMLALAPADPLRLDAEARAHWGTYYDHSPQVCAVSVGAAFEVLCEAACKR